jgi:hypothetical protein
VAVAIVAGALANKPGSGGEAWVRLSWILGLRRLGFDVFFVERLATNDEVGRRYFEQVVADFGLAERSGLIDAQGEALAGRSEGELAEAAAEAEVIFNISGHLDGGPILTRSRHRVYVDLDPGFTQLWHADPSLPFQVGDYDSYVTVGLNIGRDEIPIPSGGIEWIPTLPPVVLEEWPSAAPPVGPFRFTTVATWRSPYGQVQIGDRLAGLKHHEFRKFLELPERVSGASFELALNIHEGDDADREALLAHGWKLVPPHQVASSPQAFRSYLQGSNAEFSVAQGVYVEGQTGWFSDRTAHYLACGRPALVQETGIAERLPTGEGLLTFSDPHEAAETAGLIATDPGSHQGAARRIAEQHLDSNRVLGRLLERILPLLALLMASLAVGAVPARGARIHLAGQPQVVFDWSREACATAETPDLPARAFRDHRGRVQVLVSHYENYRLIGSGLGRLRTDCHPVMSSNGAARPSRFSDREWIGSLFTRDGRTVWALVHEEYQGNRHSGRCPSGSYYRCWYNAVTLARSTDGGRSYRPARRPPRHLVAGPSFRYRSDLGSRGVFGPSNIVVGPEGAFYALVRVRDLAGQRGVCAIRTRRISSPGSWRAWDGAGFGARFRDPYGSPGSPSAPCRLLAPGRIAEMTESLTYNRALGRFLLVGLAPPGPLSVGPKVRGIYFSTSVDLVHWEPRQLIAPAVTKQNYRCGERPPIAYPSVIDPDSRSRTYATSGASPFLYYTKFHYLGCRQTDDRDLMRVRLEVAR